MTESKDYIVNGVVYNLDNIWDYMDKDYWDSDDLKFDFWYRLYRHKQIFYEVMKLNGKKLRNIDNISENENDNCQDRTQEFLDKMAKDNKDYNIEIIWED